MLVSLFVKAELRITHCATFIFRNNCSSFDVAKSSEKQFRRWKSYDAFLYNSSITNCFRRGDVRSAQRLFDEMPKRSLVSWNCMISGYIKNAKLSEAQRVFDTMPTKNVVSWTALMAGYAKFGMLAEAERLFDEMPERSIVCWNSIISGCIDNNRFDKALSYFHAMPAKNFGSWAIVIGGYIQEGRMSEARQLFDEAPEKVTYLYNALLSGYVKLGYYKEAWELFEQIPIPDVASWTTMISCFSKARDMDRARALFEVMPEPCTEAYTVLIGGYLQLGDVKNAQKLFGEMPHKDFVAWNLMINGYVKNGLSKEALALFCQMPRKDTRTWNSILQGYVQEGDMENALICFNKIPQKDITSWNIMISGYQSEESLHFLARMTREGFVPDQGSFTVLVSICGFLAFLAYGRGIHSCSVKCGCDQDVKVASSLIAMYSKCGLAEEASEIFDRMPRRDTIAWNARLLAQTYHGTAAETFVLFRSMIQAGYQPDHVTFLSLLSTCAHNGLVDEGLNLFASMLREWKLAPQSEHYTCIVDLFGRSGRLTEAYKFLKQLPAELSTDACESLLSACRVHGNLEMAEVVANRLLGSKPSDGGLYVLLANIYTDKGMWENAARIRSNMKVQCTQKEKSCSWIEIEGKMIAFLSSDRSHSQIAEIHSILGTILYVMEEV